VRLDADAQDELGRAYAGGLLSARGRHRVVRVAQTVADLAGRDRVGAAEILLALSLRQRSGAEAVVFA
jgi:magnesium chelatase family protein